MLSPAPPNPKALKILSPQEAALSLPHRNYHRAQTVFFVGRRDQGKTSALRMYIEHSDPRVFALDPFNDFTGLRARGSFWDALNDMDGDEPMRRRFVPPDVVDSRAFGRSFFKAVVEHLRECLLVLDELTLWTDENPTTHFEMLILQARKFRLRLAIATQEIQYAPAVCQGQVTEFVLFNVQGPRNLQRVKEWCGEQAAEMCPNLRQGECLVVSL